MYKEYTEADGSSLSVCSPDCGNAYLMLEVELEPLIWHIDTPDSDSWFRFSSNIDQHFYCSYCGTEIGFENGKPYRVKRN